MSDKKVSIIFALSRFDCTDLSVFEDAFAHAENHLCDREDRIKELTLKKLRAARAAARMKKIRHGFVLAFAAALLCTMIIATAAIGASLVRDKADFEDKPSADSPLLNYKTFNNTNELEKYLKGEGRDTPWGTDFEKTGKIPLLVSLASEQNSRFGLQYDSLEVITDDESIGNGYVIHLLYHSHKDIFSACLERGIDIKGSFEKGEYSSGSVLINGKECAAVKIAEGGEFNKYYVLYGSYLYELNASDDGKVNDLKCVK